MAQLSALCCALLLGFASALSFNAEEAKERPVTKVITLMKDMIVQLESEAKEDEEVYDKMVCWCESGDKEKTKSIADAEQHLTDLTASIEELTATSARLTTEVAALEKEVKANGQALDEATALRQKELAEFVAEEKDSVQSIAGLKSAIVALSKHHSAAMLQSDTIRNLADMLGSHTGKYKDILAGAVTPTQKRKVTSFLQTGVASDKNKYAPQSGEIFGILNNMKESFETNLANAQKNEADAIAAYQELKAAKTDEINSGTDQIEAKTQETATADEKCAADKQDREDTTKTLAADQDYLAMLKETCSNMDAQMEERTKTRTEEIGAVSKAMAVLTSDEAHETFTNTFNFAQLRAGRSQQRLLSTRRAQAATVLERAASKLSSAQLANLATTVRLNAFGAVKDVIEKMIKNLEIEKEDEVAHRDWCIEEFSNTEKATELKSKDRDAATAKVEDLTATIEELTKLIEALNAEIADMQLQIKHAGEDRELENREYKQTVMDQRVTQKLLTEALNVLKGFYDKGAALIQVQQGQHQPGPPPPGGFKEYKKDKGGGPMGMIKGIIAEAKALEQEAIHAEEDAQKSYEDMVRDTNAAIDEADKDLTNKKATKGKAEGDKAEAEVALEAAMSELEGLSNKSNDLHSSCDFVVKNFDIRQSRRDDEMEALHSAIGLLSGR